MAEDLLYSLDVSFRGGSQFGVISMTTGLFIIARWVLTFGIPLAIAAHQLILVRRAQEADNAVAIPAE
jgi:hypothetical protein